MSPKAGGCECVIFKSVFITCIFKSVFLTCILTCIFKSIFLNVYFQKCLSNVYFQKCISKRVFSNVYFQKSNFKRIYCPICHLSLGAVSVSGIDSFRSTIGGTPFNLKQKTLLTFSTVVGHTCDIGAQNCKSESL